MNDKVSQQEINDILWRACDTFRGTVDATEYKDYILVMLFVKYISDTWKDHYEEYKKQYGDDEERIRRRLERERFVLPEQSAFDYLYANREAANLGELINIALEHVEMANKAKLTNVFRNIDFNSESRLGNTKKRNHILKHMLEDFSDSRLDLRPSRIGTLDVIGNAYEYLIGKFAAGAGKRRVNSIPRPKCRFCYQSCWNPRQASASATRRVVLVPYCSSARRSWCRQLLPVRARSHQQHLGAVHDEYVPA